MPPFYVAFILAPLASNASECIASYSYATKKTKKTITVSLAALEGAPCMDTTLCLSPLPLPLTLIQTLTPTPNQAPNP